MTGCNSCHLSIIDILYKKFQEEQLHSSGFPEVVDTLLQHNLPIILSRLPLIITVKGVTKLENR